jgi:hypothetical protein
LLVDGLAEPVSGSARLAYTDPTPFAVAPPRMLENIAIAEAD